MDFKLLPLDESDLTQFKSDMKEAFQMGAEQNLPQEEFEEVLPDKDIEDSLSKDGAVSYKAVVDGKMVGGAIVIINSKTHHNHLDFLYVKHGIQSKGIGRKMWKAIEQLYPDTEIWETCTPYFEKRNIHFYINRLGFSAVEFFNPHHKDPHIPDDVAGGDYFFRFEKKNK